nr:uncharacterized protein LOC109157030 [Ipomoea batatas]GME06740.1 uncharacterized protein LOC109157030 [Ipomoea batatas]
MVLSLRPRSRALLLGVGGVYEIEILKELATAKVSDFILDSRCWDLPKLNDLLPNDLVENIQAIPIPTNHSTSA